MANFGSLKHMNDIAFVALWDLKRRLEERGITVKLNPDEVKTLIQITPKSATSNDNAILAISVFDIETGKEIANYSSIIVWKPVGFTGTNQPALEYFIDKHFLDDTNKIIVWE